MRGYFRFETKRHGVFTIRPINGRWRPFHGEESLGSYPTAQAALDDLAGGHSDWPSAGFDPAIAGLPDDLAAWEFVPFAR